LSSLGRARRTQATELQVVPPDHEASGLAGPGVDGPVDGQVQVDDGIAAVTQEVVVRPHVGVQAVEGAAEGDPAQATLLDEDAELRPVSLYARTKIASERTILSMGDTYFAPTILRMGTLYGCSPRMRFDLVVNTMTMNAFSEGRIRVFGGRQWRPLLSVQDAADAYVLCIEADISRVGNQVFNVGSDAQNYQIEDIAQIIARTLGDVDVQHDHKSLDVRDYRVNFKKVCDALGFQATDTVPAATRIIYSRLAQGLIPDPSQKIYYNHFFDVTEE